MAFLTAVLTAMLWAFSLSGCGGGAGPVPPGGGPPPGASIHIQMAIEKGGTTADPVYAVTGVILRGTSTLVADATVAVNGVAIPYIGIAQQYQHLTAPIHVAGNTFHLTIQLDGVTYSAIGDEYAVVSSFTGPAPGSVIAAATNTFSWSPTSPSGRLSGYRFQVGCFQQLAFKYPPPGAPLHPVGVTSDTVPAGTFTAGLQYAAQIMPVQELPIAGATSGSVLSVLDGTNSINHVIIFTAQ